MARDSIDSRIADLERRRSAPDIPVLLALVDDVLRARGRFLAELPDELIARLNAGASEPLLAAYGRVRTLRDEGRGSAARRTANQATLRRWLDVLGVDDDARPTLHSRELPCRSCGWPAVRYCRLCKWTECGLERCVPRIESPGERDRDVCSHTTSDGDCLIPISNEDVARLQSLGTSASAEPVPGEVIVLTREWQHIGAIGVDAGMVGVVPAAGGRGIKSWTGIGDGTFPVEGRLRDEEGSLELRVLLGSGTGRTMTLGGCRSRSGFFLLCDPIVAPRTVYDLESARGGRVWIAQAGAGILVRAASASAGLQGPTRNPVRFEVRFQPTVHIS